MKAFKAAAIKAGKGIQLGSELIPEYKPIYNKMVSLGAPPTASDAYKQNRLVKKLIKAGSFAKAEIIDVFATQPGASLINWANPNAINPTKNNNPTFEPYRGYKSIESGKHYIKTNFNPSLNATKMGVADVSILFGINENSVVNGRSGSQSYDGTTNELFYTIVNKSTNLTNTSGVINKKTEAGGYSINFNCKSSKKHFCFTKSGAGSYRVGVNLAQHPSVASFNQSNEGLLKDDIMVGCYKIKQYNDVFFFDTRQYSYYMVTKALTIQEERDTILAFEEYLSSIGIPLLEDNVYNLGMHGHSFFTGGLSQPTLPYILDINTKCFRSTNPRLGSSLITQYIAEAPIALDSYIEHNMINLLVTWMGNHEVTSAVGSGTSSYNSHLKYVNDRLAAGWNKIIVCTMTPEVGMTGQRESERVIFNTKIRNEMSLIPGVTIYDTDSVTEFKTPVSNTYFSDGIHFSQAGLLIASDDLLEIINSLI